MRTWVFVMNTGRFGDWIVRKADTLEQAEKQLTRSQRKKVWYVEESRPTRVWLGREAA